MNKVSRLSGGYGWGLIFAGTGLACIFIPGLIQNLELEFEDNSLVKDFSVSLFPEDGSLRTKHVFPAHDLIARLEEADQQWQPQEEILPDGSTRYLYKRRHGEPDLSVSELRKLVESPPSFHLERQEVLELLQTLQSSGVNIQMTPTFKKGAAAEWDHRRGTLRIQPHMAERGSIDFLKVLSHEALHVAQSCRAGSLRAKPKPLGLSLVETSELHKKLSDPIYMNATTWEKNLEKEAYGSQEDSQRVKELLRKECKLAVNVAN